MARKAAKPTSGSVPRNSSKRPASGTPTRQSKRPKATARKSYAEPDTDTDDAIDHKSKRDTPPTEGEDDAVVSVYEDEDQSDKDASSESEHDATASEEDGQAEKSTPRGRAARENTLPTRKKHVGEQDLWKPGAKLAPGTQLIIKKPKARDPGDTPYTDATVHPNTMLFLKDLAANNERQWLKMHDPDYRASLQDFTTFTEKVSEKVIDADETIPELPVKDVVSYQIGHIK
ncbi:hypothetical protein N0V83_006218 [Neocucurbitaria cava]|uniref:Uncharacterized protein n=1 Tax=Neocucurbitaria cava TaxID=798079 RepID=A0A9W9CL13_9PLEO|nr:hypothetical protein N0V83_006218 [Neocucurbitaria cava]